MSDTSKKKVEARSPTRVDLAGGTLDMWPLYNFVDDALTVNLAIDIWTRAEMTARSSGICIESRDMSLKLEFASLPELLAHADPRLKLFQVILRYWQPQGPFHLVTESQSPIGGGLGGSSSLIVTLQKALMQWQGQRAPSSVEFALLSHNLESRILRTPAGTQDYFPPISGGLSILKYGFNGIEHRVLPSIAPEVFARFLLVYTGKSHHSGINNFEVLKNAVQGDSGTLQALQNIAQVARETAQICETGAWHKLAAQFKLEFEHRRKLAEAFSSPEIEKLHDLTLSAGAEAVKICGAGGGGCVLVWCAPERKAKVAEACKNDGFQVLNARPVAPLSQV
jgi:D-glycero-alpha-D-manno-heptose-7-phosphate kinase